jgi:glycosyltransferase involved in cell wall biosynthesis
MKIAFCVISNRPDRMLRFISTFKNVMLPQHQYAIALSHQPPYTAQDVAECRAAMPKGAKLIAGARRKDSGRLFNATNARNHAFDLAKGYDFLVMADDDFMFKPANKKNVFKISAGDRFGDAIEYMQKNKGCGCVLMKGFRGGDKLKRKIIPMLGGYYETALGVVLRGKGRPYKDLLYPPLNMPGIGEDVVVCITPFIHGQYTAKALNTPVKKDVTKKVVVKPGDPTVNLSDNPNYVAAQKNIFKKIDELFGPWRHGYAMPKQLYKKYKENFK